MNRIIALTLAALAACSPDFDPASKVDKLRVLAIRADPPEIEPPPLEPSGPTTVAPDRARLTSLVLRPDDFDPENPRTTTIVHVACVPVPGDPDPTPCVMLANLRDPAVAIAEGARQACDGAPASGGGPPPPWPPIEFVGVETCVDASCGPVSFGGVPILPPELVVTTAVRERFNALPDGAPDRILGVQAVVLAFALEAAPDELVAGLGTCPAGDVAANLARLWSAREHVLAMKRVAIRGPEAHDPEPNHNPSFDPRLDIRASGTLLDPVASTTVDGRTVYLEPVAPGTREPYTELDAKGTAIRATTEEWVFSWFATAGEMDELHTDDGEIEEWKVDAGAHATVAVVVRDLRGGVGWAVRRVRVTP